MNGRMQSAPGSAIGGARGRMRGRRASSSATSAAPSASASPLGSKATRTPAPATTTGRPSAAAPNAPKHTHLVLYLSISLGSQQYAILKNMHACSSYVPRQLNNRFLRSYASKRRGDQSLADRRDLHHQIINFLLHPFLCVPVQ
jgi:hypothetical protein